MRHIIDQVSMPQKSLVYQIDIWLNVAVFTFYFSMYTGMTTTENNSYVELAAHTTTTALMFTHTSVRPAIKDLMTSLQDSMEFILRRVYHMYLFTCKNKKLYCIIQLLK